MPSFQHLFEASKGKPILYEGTVIQMVDYLPISAQQRIKITFESVSSDFRQGIGLSTDQTFVVNDQVIKKKIVLWRDTAPTEVFLDVTTKKGQCSVKNVWDPGDGVIHSWHHGAAMIVETLDRGRRYRCNDGIPDDDFDDIIFRIELFGAAGT